MSVSINFLLQAIKIISNDNHFDHELDMVYEFLISISEEDIKFFYKNSTVVTYPNDLELYMQTIQKLISIYEEKEKYEQCLELKKKYDRCQIIMQEP